MMKGIVITIIFPLLLSGMLLCSCLGKDNPVTVNHTARFTVISPGCIRLEYSSTGNFIDDRSLFAVNRSTDFHQFAVTTGQNETVIETSKLRLMYKPDGKSFSPDNLEIIVRIAKKEIRWTPALTNTENLGGTLPTLDQVAKELPLNDGLLSQNGWYLYDDSRRPLLTDEWVKQRPFDAGTDWYFFAYGFDYKAALHDLATISGKIPLPRKYAFGSWYSRYWPYSSDDYRQIVKEYDQHDFPLDIMVLDMDWHKDGWTGWSWNRKLLPDAEDLLRWFHQRNIHVTMNIHPSEGIKPHEDMYSAFMKDMGVDASIKPDSVIPFDASNKTYLDKLFSSTHAPHEEEGVDFWWLDWQQFEKTLGNPDLRNLEWLNDYYFRYSQRKGLRGLSFSRWGGWGDHRHPIHFSGDADTHWPMLEFEVPFTTNAGNVLCFFWSHDIGGHMGGFMPETNCRWIQFGAMSAALRLHSTRDETMDKRPWIRDSIYVNSERIAFHLRSQLFPYIYTSAWQAVSDVVPLTCPMYIEYPEQSIAYQVPQQYLFGKSLLVAPITSPGAGPGKVADQLVWFPQGTWYNWFTGERFSGTGRLVNVLADINEFPLYAKAGMPIVMQPYASRMATEPLKQLVVRVFPGANDSDNTSLLYEDDGVTKEYENGKYALTEIHYRRKGSQSTITIKPISGGFTGEMEERSYCIEFPCTKPSTKASINGIETKPEYEPELAMNRVRTERFNTHKEVIIQLDAEELDNSILTARAHNRRMTALFGTLRHNDSLTDDQSLQTLKNTLSAGDYDKIAEYVSGVRVAIRGNHLVIFKSSDSKCSNGFTFTLDDVTPVGQRNIMTETFTLLGGEYRIFQITEPVSGNTTIKTTRIMNLQFSVGGKDTIYRKVISTTYPSLKDWSILGPFDYNPEKDIRDVCYAPETDTTIDFTKTYTGKANTIIQWRSMSGDKEGLVDLGSAFNEKNAIAYGRTSLRSECEQSIKFLINSDDGIELWLNHEKIHSHHVFRGVSHTPDEASGTLKKGINELLVKISQQDGGWSFMVKIDPSRPVQLRGLPDGF